MGYTTICFWSSSSPERCFRPTLSPVQRNYRRAGAGLKKSAMVGEQSQFALPSGGKPQADSIVRNSA
jgi:hypothetical protein